MSTHCILAFSIKLPLSKCSERSIVTIFYTYTSPLSGDPDVIMPMCQQPCQKHKHSLPLSGHFHALVWSNTGMRLTSPPPTHNILRSPHSALTMQTSSPQASEPSKKKLHFENFALAQTHYRTLNSSIGSPPPNNLDNSNGFTLFSKA